MAWEGIQRPRSLSGPAHLASRRIWQSDLRNVHTGPHRLRESPDQYSGDARTGSPRGAQPGGHTLAAVALCFRALIWGEER